MLPYSSVDALFFQSSFINKNLLCLIHCADHGDDADVELSRSQAKDSLELDDDVVAIKPDDDRYVSLSKRPKSKYEWELLVQLTLKSTLLKIKSCMNNLILSITFSK